MKFAKHLIAAALTTASAFSAFAQNVTVTDAWARATVQGQKATGAFMKITAKDNSKLVGVTSPVAGVGEIHEMKMDKDVMRMSALPNGLDDAPATQRGANCQRDAGGHLRPQRHRHGVGVAGGQQQHRDHTHCLLGVVAAVTERESRCRNPSAAADRTCPTFRPAS